MGKYTNGLYTDLGQKPQASFRDNLGFGGDQSDYQAGLDNISSMEAFADQRGLDLDTMSISELGEFETYWKNRADNPTSAGMDFGDMADFGLGLGSLAMSVASFSENKKTNKLNREIKGQQIASNDYEMNKRTADDANLKSVFATS